MISFLALGDSYTIGEAVDPVDRWTSHLVRRLGELGLDLDEPKIIARTGWTTDELDAAVDEAKQNGPFDLDLVFAPDGIERFEDAWERHVEVEGFPVCHLDDIIASKAATNRVKDREALPRLRSFREYWLRKHRDG